MQNTKILVAFGTKLGSTEKIARLIGETIRNDGGNVDVVQIDQISSLADYSAVILGGPIRYDDWIPEMKTFVKRHSTTLDTLPHAAFFSCLTLVRKNAKAKADPDTYATKIAALFPDVWPRDVGQFAGVLDYSKMPRFSRLVARIIFSILRVPAGDYRDERTIRAWAKQLSQHQLL